MNYFTHLHASFITSGLLKGMGDSTLIDLIQVLPKTHTIE